MTATMTSRERMVAAIGRQPHDRVPVCGPAVWSGVQPDLMEMNYTYEEVFQDPEKLCRVALRAHTVYGFDLITIPMDMRTEAEGYGSKVVYDLPTSNGFRLGMVRDWVVHTEKDLSKLKPYDPQKVPRMAMILEAVHRVREVRRSFQFWTVPALRWRRRSSTSTSWITSVSMFGVHSSATPSRANDMSTGV